MGQDIRTGFKTGVKMRLHERYVDDSNQGAEVPPPGSKYDKERRNVIQDENEIALRDNEGPGERLARILKEIAIEVQDGIVMEEDYPEKNKDNQIAILDMKAWINIENFIVYQHYIKPITSRQVISVQLAQSSSCKKSVHTREMIRRIVNTSTRLDWCTHVAPVLTDYMGRMMQAGYDKIYRKKDS